MLGNDAFYHGSVRKAIVGFGNLFKNIHIQRKDANGILQKTIRVPITFAEKDKWYYRAMQDPHSGTDDAMPVQNILPRMSFDMVGMTYDPSRKSASTGRYYKALSNSNDSLLNVFNPVPYQLNFNLYIMSKYYEDGAMIYEQILPFFAPTFVLEAKHVPELQLNREIPYTLTGINLEDQWDGTYDTKRLYMQTLSFTADIMMYPPVKTLDVITLSRVNLSIESNGAIFRVEETTPEEGANPGDDFGVRTQIYEP